MSTWKKGRARLAAIVQENTLPMDLFLADIRRSQPHRVPGTAVFLTSNPEGAPPVLLHHLKHNQVLHEKVMLLSSPPRRSRRWTRRSGCSASELGEGFYQVVAHYGFMETPDVPDVLRRWACRADGRPVTTKLASTTFYLGRETLIPTGPPPGARRRRSATRRSGAWRGGGRSSSSSWPGTRSRPPRSSGCRRIGWWSSGAQIQF